MYNANGAAAAPTKGGSAWRRSLLRRNGGAEKDVSIIDSASGREWVRNAAVKARLATLGGMAVVGLSCLGASYVRVDGFLRLVEAMGFVR